MVRNGDQRAIDGEHVADAPVVTALPTAAGARPTKADRRAAELLAQAEAARKQAQILAARLRVTQQQTAETVQHLQAARDRAKMTRALRRGNRADLLQHSAYARLQAQLASMPVIEQAKGIIMAQCRCSEDQAFDALRKASQRENIKVRDLAARVVANTARPPAARRRPSAAPRPGQEASQAEAVRASAGA